MLTTQLTETESSTSITETNTDVEQTEEAKNCENCHLPLNGPFCANCGQEADSKLKYFWVVIMHLLDDIFSFDSRASRTVWPLVTRPAFLTNEYFSGRRVHYVPPLRLYLFISIVFFITLKYFAAADDGNKVNDNKAVITQVKEHIKSLKISSVKKNTTIDEAAKLTNEIAKFNAYLTDLKRDSVVGNNKQIIKLTRELVALEFEKDKAAMPEDEKIRFDALMASLLDEKNDKSDSVDKKDLTIANNKDGTLSFDFLSDEKNKVVNNFVKELTEKAEKAFNSDTRPLVEQAIGKLPQLMFILLPLFAVLLKVMFIFSNRLYMEHLTVALHSHSFIFIVVLLSEMLDLLNEHLATTSPSIANLFGVVAGGLLWWIPIYLFLMQKKVYKQGYFFTLVKFGIISTIYSMMILLTGLIAIVWGLMGT